MPEKKKKTTETESAEKPTRKTTKKAATEASAEEKTVKKKTTTKKAAAEKEEKTETAARKATSEKTASVAKEMSAEKATAAKKAAVKKAEAAAEEVSAAKTTKSRTTKSAAKTTKATTSTRSRSKAKPAAQAIAEENVVAEPPAAVAVAPTDVREHFVETLHPLPAPPPERDLPPEYGDTKIVLLVRDPEWVFAYWEINDETRQRYELPRTGFRKRLVLRMYNVTGRKWPEEKAQYFFDIDVGPYANNWYIRVPESDASWVGELGVFEDNGEYVPIVASNVVHVPREGMSPETDEEWMVIEETFRKIFESSGGTRIRDGWRGSEELWRHIQKHVLPALQGGAQLGGSAGLMGSGGLAAAKQAPAPSSFWLVAETELILYGATEPTAQVTVNDEPVTLRPDGTFSLRFALPDGEQTLVVKARSADGQHERMITKVVTKRTR